MLVELKDIELPESMKRATTREAEAEREKRAKIIAAEGEALSADKLTEAADVISNHPIALQLRNLQVLGKIAVERNSTIVFPAQFLDSFREIARFVGGERASEPQRLPRRSLNNLDLATTDTSWRTERRAHLGATHNRKADQGNWSLRPSVGRHSPRAKRERMIEVAEPIGVPLGGIYGDGDSVDARRA